MSEVNGLYQVRMNGKIIHEAIDPSPIDFSNVQATLGNVYGTPQLIAPFSIGRQRNFKIRTAGC